MRNWRERLELDEESARSILGQDPRQLLLDLASLLEGAHPDAPPASPGAQLVPLPRMLRAYQAIRPAVSETARSELGRALDADEVTALNAAMDALLAERAGSAIGARMDGLNFACAAYARFTSFLNHEIRGSLNGMALMLEVLKREMGERGDCAQSVADLQLMRRSIADLIAALERQIMLQRLTSGRQQISPGRLELRSVVNEIVGELSADADDAGHPIQADIASAAAVVADRRLLHLVLCNLLGNAIRHTPAGPIIIQTRPHAEGWAVLVRDSGPGIAPDRLATLLDPQRLVASEETGSGLLLVHEAMRALRGRFEATSSPRGSIFAITLPAALDEAV